MEKLPYLPMLYFDLKQSSRSVDFKKSIENRIKEIYGQNPKDFQKEIQEFEFLRATAVRVTHDVNGCFLLKRYYAQLSILNNKFHYTSRSCDIKFSWTDIFTKHHVTSDIQLELNSILFNIGALHSELGAASQRNTSEEIKSSCTDFQCAAWVFKKLRECTHSLSKDLNPELMKFNHIVLLAQAQECILEKSILDKRNEATIAKIAAEVTCYYDDLIVILIQSECQEKDSLQDIVGVKLYKEWKNFIEFKANFYLALCSYFMGIYEKTKIGEKIAWLISADEKLKSSVKLAKNTETTDITTTINYLSNLIKVALEKTKKDNDFIYHEVIPTLDKLSAVKGVSLVKEIEFSISDPDIMGKDIFHKLVPIEAYENLSIYSDYRDNLWREIKLKIDEKNEKLAKFLSLIQLDKENIRKRKFNVSEKLLGICAAYSKKNFLNDLITRFNELEDLSKNVDKEFISLEKIIQNEEEFEKKNGLFDSKNSIKELRNTFNKHFEVHKSAMESNKNLFETVELYQKDIEFLGNSSVEDLENLFSASAKDVNENVEEKNLSELERLFDKIKEMKEQRDHLEKKIREQIKENSFNNSLVAHSKEEMKQVFEKEKGKLDVDINYLKQNMKAQKNIIDALVKENESYAQTRKAFIKMEKLRNEKIESYYDTYEKIESIIINLDKGFEFYADLKKIIQTLQMNISIYIENRKKNSLIDDSKTFSDSKNQKKVSIDKPIEQQKFYTSNVSQMPIDQQKIYSNNYNQIPINQQKIYPNNFNQVPINTQNYNYPINTYPSNQINNFQNNQPNNFQNNQLNSIQNNQFSTVQNNQFSSVQGNPFSYNQNNQFNNIQNNQVSNRNPYINQPSFQNPMPLQQPYNNNFVQYPINNYPPNNNIQGINYNLQNLKINNPVVPNNFHQNLNYNQQQLKQVPSVPIDSILSSSNELSEDIQPVLKPTIIPKKN